MQSRNCTSILNVYKKETTIPKFTIYFPELPWDIGNKVIILHTTKIINRKTLLTNLKTQIS